MSLLKPDNIIGLDTENALYANILAFWELGQQDIDLVSSVALVGGDYSDHPDLGECRTFNSSTVGFNQTLLMGTGHTIVFILQSNAVFLSGGGSDTALLGFNSGANYFEVIYAGFSGYQVKTVSRASFGSYIENKWLPHGTAGQFNAPQALALVNSISPTAPTLYINGTSVEAASSQGGTVSAYETNPTAHQPLKASNTSDNTSVSAIIVFDKELSPSELASVTTSPWAMVDSVEAPAVTTTDTLQPGTEFTLTATNYASAPVSPATLTDSEGSTITVPVTISGSGPYTAVGTMPTLAEAVTAGASLLFGDVTIELST